MQRHSCIIIAIKIPRTMTPVPILERITDDKEEDAPRMAKVEAAMISFMFSILIRKPY